MNGPQHILVTGGLGFIGSHTALSLLEAGYGVTILDDLSNSYEECFHRLKELAGGHAARLDFVKADVRDKGQVLPVFRSRRIDAVIHFAAKKSVGESVADPLKYYDHNVGGTVALLQAMQEAGCHQLVFSSSACVYGEPEKVPIDESAPLHALNPYGRTKASVMMEEVMGDVAAADPRWCILLLRYFNPVGAHPSAGRIGEHPQMPTNLMPCITEAVYGTDYPTRDGTALRDYIHVMDLAEGHVAALRRLFAAPDLACKPINLGTGTGQTVMEMIKAFEEASGRSVPRELAGRRAGDAAAVYASPQLAEAELGWRARRSLHDMCADHWRWTVANPQGFLTKAPPAVAAEPAGTMAAEPAGPLAAEM
ncbi:hypothetical protein CHLNCDRAFT_137493 [Chlorella variabilis]|uniref:UDP-glucose 4-epimerase n=1 Tax=Chlorella variabilis TaxID=554065 RepID=E1ZMJ9_CHLVA|nr:hypothetical protein CHLNCDRAFT_137493 [Chlorella variabilis]EFN53129.1 hypothetical protein CHLNCDRAFT_137493 [Chlorella variabilis]|eukprot:XP_005845231.1 hypothetical protein CHLNCDRAFT_137493 [Chlorella variabilis]